MEFSTLISNNFFKSSIIFISATLVTTIFTPLLIKVGIKHDLTDKPNTRKKHKNSLVNLGGLSMLIGMLISLLIIFFIKSFDNNSLMPNDNLIIFSIGGFSLIYYLIGFADDLYSLSPFIRLLIQILGSIFLWSISIKIDKIDFNLFNISNTFVFSNSLSLILTVLWIAGMINAINWMDGIDGLASGTAFISSIGFLIIGFEFNNILSAYLASALAGSTIGFFFFNFNPAKIIMGDGGSYLLGLNLSIISILSASNNNSISGYFYLSLMILFIPIFDMTRVIIYRINKGHSPYYPDRNHLHHIFLDAGYNDKRTAYIILIFVQWFTCLALLLAQVQFSKLIFIFSTMISIFILFRSYKSLKSRETYIN